MSPAAPPKTSKKSGGHKDATLMKAKKSKCTGRRGAAAVAEALQQVTETKPHKKGVKPAKRVEKFPEAPTDSKCSKDMEQSRASEKKAKADSTKKQGKKHSKGPEKEDSKDRTTGENRKKDRTTSENHKKDRTTGENHKKDPTTSKNRKKDPTTGDNHKKDPIQRSSKTDTPHQTEKTSRKRRKDQTETPGKKLKKADRDKTHKKSKDKTGKKSKRQEGLSSENSKDSGVGAEERLDAIEAHDSAEAHAASDAQKRTFQDESLNCRDCHSLFVFSAACQEINASKGFTHKPTRCTYCKMAYRDLLAKAKRIKRARIYKAKMAEQWQNHQGDYYEGEGEGEGEGGDYSNQQQWHQGGEHTGDFYDGN